MSVADLIAAVSFGVTLLFVAFRLVAKMGHLIQTIETLVSRFDELKTAIEVEGVQRRHSDAELHSRIDDLLTPRPGRVHG
jgi:type II secretory pathway component PulJ